MNYKYHQFLKALSTSPQGVGIYHVAVFTCLRQKLFFGSKNVCSSTLQPSLLEVIGGSAAFFFTSDGWGNHLRVYLYCTWGKRGFHLLGRSSLSFSEKMSTNLYTYWDFKSLYLQTFVTSQVFSRSCLIFMTSVLLALMSVFQSHPL